jgi:hypothetical protein
MTDKIPFRAMHPQFENSFEYYHNVPDDFREALWMYFAYGIEPGGFGMAVLSNDFAGAVCRAHAMLTANTFRDLAKWLISCAPLESYGNNENIKSWKSKTDEERRDIMIEYGLRPSVIDILKGNAIA